jgi:SAM-dependent methyltransferase
MAFESVLRGQYARTMQLAYAFARASARAGAEGAAFLDCGCGVGNERDSTLGGLAGATYTGLEWNPDEAARARAGGVHVIGADLNRVLPVADASQDRVLAYSVLEHLLMPCHFIAECHRVLRPGGRLVVLTPNIATWFTALLVMLGRMPSSGPHPDSNSLLRAFEVASVSRNAAERDVSGDMPAHRHLVVFSFLALRRYLGMAGFEVRAARGFGYYPLPRFMQPWFERIDPYHCHQMVFVCEKPGAPPAAAG